MPRAFHSVCIWWLRFPDAFSLMISSPLSSSMYALVYPHAPSIHPSDHRLRFLLPLSGHPLFFFFLLRCLPELLMLNNRCAAAAPPPKDSRVHISFPWTSSHMTCTASSSTSQGCIPQCPALFISFLRSIAIDKANG
jgi:hypothetical protein